MTEEDAGFGKYDDLLDNEYGGNMENMYREAGGKRDPNFDCPMQAILRVEKLEKSKSENPKNEIADYSVAKFVIKRIKSQGEPVEEGKESVLGEDVRVSDFNRLPGRTDVKPPFQEEQGYRNVSQMIAAIIGLRPDSMENRILNAAYSGGGEDVAGLHVGVIVEPDKYILSDYQDEYDGTPWGQVPSECKGVNYDPTYYPVSEDQSHERIQAGSFSDCKLA